MYRPVNSAKDSQGGVIKIGDKVEWLDFYNYNKPTGVIATVLKIRKQGYDGTILTCDKSTGWNKVFKEIRAKHTIKRGC